MQNNKIETCSTHNGGKSLVSERFIITFKNKLYKYMTSISKKVYINKLDEIVNSQKKQKPNQKEFRI